MDSKIIAKTQFASSNNYYKTYNNLILLIQSIYSNQPSHAINKIIRSTRKEFEILCKEVGVDIKIWVVYLVQCKNNSLYCGITNNLFNRISAHNSNSGAKFTKGKGPVTLIWFKETSSKSEALKLEHYVKSLSKDKKLSFHPKTNIKI